MNVPAYGVWKEKGDILHIVASLLIGFEQNEIRARQMNNGKEIRLCICTCFSVMHVLRDNCYAIEHRTRS